MTLLLIQGTSPLLSSSLSSYSVPTTPCQANLDLFPVCLDRCYDCNKGVARGYFQVGDVTQNCRKSLVHTDSSTP